MNLYEKLLLMQQQADSPAEADKAAPSGAPPEEAVLARLRSLMDQLGLLLIPRVERVQLHQGTTRTGAPRYLAELRLTMVWHDAASGEELAVPWYAQGVDVAGDQGADRALARGERSFLLRFFHVRADGPPAGDRRQPRPDAACYRAAISQMLDELYGGDREKIAEACISYTRAPYRGFAGVDSPDAVHPAALPALCGKVKKAYAQQTGREFILKQEDSAT